MGIIVEKCWLRLLNTIGPGILILPLLWITSKFFKLDSVNQPEHILEHVDPILETKALHNGTLLQYSCLENPMDGGAWKAAVHGVTVGRARLSDFTFTFHFSLSCVGEGNGNPLQYSCLENPRDGGAWWAAVYGVTQSRTRLK